ncbi:MAG: type II secretion system protein [Patescibacteria group bacterium]
MKIFQKNSSYGFTLIELLVVIAIISLLSSVVLASVQTATGRANAVYKLQTARQYMNAFALYQTDNDSYPRISGMGVNSGFCLGASNPNDTCYNTEYTESDTFNDEISSYISGLPSDTKSLIVEGSDIRGIVYQCLAISNNICTSYAIRWFIEGNTPNCGEGVSVPAVPTSGFLECVITK